MRRLLLATVSAALLGAAGFIALSTHEPTDAPGSATIGDGLSERTPAETRQPSAPSAAVGGTREDPETLPDLDAPIEGSIALVAAAVPGLDELTVEIVEAINPNASSARAPFRATQTLRLRKQTPQFRFAAVPFSEYGYQIRVRAKDRNGSETHVRHSVDRPAGPVSLTLRPGVSFAVRLHDSRDRTAVGDLPVWLVHRDREPVRADAGPDGRACFTGILAGRYAVCVAEISAPRNGEQTINVPDRGSPEDIDVAVPRGSDLTIRVHGPSRAIAAARIAAHRVDRLPSARYAATTGDDGRGRLLRLPPGDYLVRVEADGHRSTQAPITVALGQIADLVVGLEPD